MYRSLFPTIVFIIGVFLVGCSKQTPESAQEPNAMTQKDLSVNYLEMPLVNHAETKSFYQSVFGWEFQDWGPDYMCFLDAGINLGFNRQLIPGPIANGALVVIYADDLEKTESRIREAGQTIVKETYGFPGGRRFHFTDPNGNEIAVWTQVKE